MKKLFLCLTHLLNHHSLFLLLLMYPPLRIVLLPVVFFLLPLLVYVFLVISAILFSSFYETPHVLYLIVLPMLQQYFLSLYFDVENLGSPVIIYTGYHIHPKNTLFHFHAFLEVLYFLHNNSL